MKTNTILLLSGLPLAVALFLTVPLNRPSQAQEAQPQPNLAKREDLGTTGSHLLTTVGRADEKQASALQRARLERELVLAERTAQMMDAVEAALSDMESPGPEASQESEGEGPR